MQRLRHHPAKPGKPHLQWVEVQGRIRHVSTFRNLPPEDRPSTHCPTCGQLLILKLGSKRQHHAAHRPGSTCTAATAAGAKKLNEQLEEEQRTRLGELPPAQTNAAEPPPPAEISESFAHVHLIGYAGDDPEPFRLDGQRAARFPLATHTQRRVQWHHIVATGPVGQAAETELHKGDRVYVDGDISYRTYTNGAGQAQIITEIIAHAIIPFARTLNGGAHAIPTRSR